jgi:ABC-2 type transport system permease protein
MRFQPPVELRQRAWFNPDLASRNYNVPAVIGAIITLTCLLLTSLAIVREREIGTLEQLMVSPIKPIELLIGKTIPFAVIGVVDMVLVSIIAVVFFKVPLVGNVGLLFFATLLYLLSALGMGLLISTISKTQQEAFMSTFLVFMPTILLSGFMFPVRSMPKVFQWLTYLNPLRHYLEIIRGIFLKGVGLEALWFQHVALLALGIVLMATAVARFQKHLA